MDIRVIVVEDDPFQLVLFREVLALASGTEANFHVSHAATLQEARQKIAAEPFDVALVDGMLPDGSGLGFLKEITQAHRDLPVVICAETAEQRRAARALMKEQATDYISKADLTSLPLAEMLLQAIDRKRAERDLERRAREIITLATRDDLTRLLNRRTILEKLLDLVSESRVKGIPLSCAVVNLDHLQLLNEAFGRPFGDYALRTVANVLREAAGEGYPLGRYAAGEFLVILPGVGLEETVQWAARLRVKVEQMVVDDGTAKTVLTVTVGVASTESSPQADDLEILRMADRGLRQARSAGGNCVCAGQPGTVRRKPEGAADGRDASGRENLFGTIAVERGWVRQDQLDAALAEQDRTGDPIGRILMRSGIISPTQAHRVMEEQRRRAQRLTRDLLDELREQEEEMTRARHVQQKLIPTQLVTCAGIDVAARYLPYGHVGGDFYDVFKLGPRSIAVAVGDVAGHGVPSAMVMAMATGIMRTALREDAPPREILERLNDLIIQQKMDKMFLTLAYLQLDLEAGRGECLSAGHPQPLLVDRGGRVRPVRATGMAVGITETRDFSESLVEEVLDLASLRQILLYTDGATESRDAEGQMMDVDGLTAMVAEQGDGTAEATVQGLEERIRRRAAGAGLEDDLTLVAIKLLS